MRTLSSPLSAATSAAITAPGYLVEILFSTPVRLSSRGTVDVLGSTWLTWAVKVAGLGVDAVRASQSGTLVLGNTDNTLGATILNQGISDRRISIWAFYGETPGDADVQPIFSGVGDACQFDPDAGSLSIQLLQSTGKTLFCPRRYITQEQGFSFLPPRDTIVSWNGEQYQLKGDA